MCPLVSNYLVVKSYCNILLRLTNYRDYGCQWNCAFDSDTSVFKQSISILTSPDDKMPYSVTFHT